MPKTSFLPTALVVAASGAALLSAGPVENTKTLGGYCSLYTFAKADYIREAPYPCPDALTFYQPSDADFRAGRRPTLKITFPGAPNALLEFNSAIPSMTEFGAGELAFQLINGAKIPGKCKIQSQRWRPGVEGIDLVCTANRSNVPGRSFAFVFSIGEVEMKPGEPTPRAFLLTAGPIFDQFRSSSLTASAVTLKGACRHLQNGDNIPCAPLTTVAVPTFSQLIQGRRPELLFQPTAKGSSEIIFELGPGRVAASGGHTFRVHSINGDNRVDSLAECSFDLPHSNLSSGRITCAASTQASGGNRTRHQTQFDIAASAGEIESLRFHLYRAADAAGNLNITISNDRLAVFGIMPGKPLPIGIGNCSGDLDAARLKYCFFQRPELSHKILAPREEASLGPGYRWVDLQINPKLLDRFVSGSILEILIDQQDVVQRIRIDTPTPQWTADYDALKRKYGPPSEESWPEKFDRTKQTKVAMPEATWRSGGLNIRYNAANYVNLGPGPRQLGTLTIVTDSLLRAIEQSNRQQAPTPKRPK